MIILGVDYGRAKIGLAISEGKLSAPFSVLRVSSPAGAVRKVTDIAKEEKVEKIVVGISEGVMRKIQKEFGDILREKTGVKVEMWDETLTTKDAQTLALAAGLPRKKRRGMEDAFAAAVMLQSYLDTESRQGSITSYVKGSKITRRV
ncbi:MAG: Holliday junction resolvase RuvX [Candidatus Blackburnbacteria bacterium]|nr:Holliday junction resolvase RuvX [Candidatus Blackburnbacteria bacterium]